MVNMFLYVSGFGIVVEFEFRGLEPEWLKSAMQVLHVYMTDPNKNLDTKAQVL